MKHIGIVMAAGSGKRMKSEVPKQFLEIKGKPLLYYTLRAMEESFIDEIILVVREEDEEYVKSQIVEKYNFKKVSRVTKGGRERFESVYNGLLAVSDEDSYVYIQDGARPFLSKESLERIREAVIKEGAAVLAVPVTDTIKAVDSYGYILNTPNRNSLVAAQTPQAFKYEIIKEAFVRYFENSYKSEGFIVTDDASLVERFSNTKVKFVMGDYENIKITNPRDIRLAEEML